METGRINNVPKDSQRKVYSQPHKPDPKKISWGFLLPSHFLLYICGMDKKLMTRKQILNKLQEIMSTLDMSVVRLMTVEQLRQYSKKFI